MMSLTFGLFTQVSGSGPLGPLVLIFCQKLQEFERSLERYGYQCKGERLRN